jgi:hypothetical protein
MAASDLVGLAALKTWPSISASGQDAQLAQLITAVSRSILAEIGRYSILPSAFSELYEPSKTGSIQLRNWPVNSVTSVMFGRRVIPPAAYIDGPGWWLDAADSDAPPGMPQRLFFGRGEWQLGWGYERRERLSVVYRAGYQVADEVASVPAAGPYTIAALAPYGAWASDGGVAYADGTPLLAVASSPAIGQYSVSSNGASSSPAPGLYTFNVLDAGAAVLLTYGYTPADLAYAALQWMIDQWAYQARVGLRSKTLGGQETMSWIVSAIPAFVMSAIMPYKSVALIQ